MTNTNCPGEIDNDKYRMISKPMFTNLEEEKVDGGSLDVMFGRYLLWLMFSVCLCLRLTRRLGELICTVFWLIANNWKSKIDNLFIQPQILEIGWMDKGRWLIMSEKIWLIGPPILCWRVMKKVNMNEVQALFEQRGNFYQIRKQSSNQCSDEVEFDCRII